MFTIGVDFGGVLSVHDAQAGCEHRNVCINMPNAMSTLESLKSKGHRLVLVSFAGKSRSQETMDELMTSCPDLFDSIYFVKDKKHKRAICEHAGCDVMIDDSTEVLEHFAGSATVPILYGSSDPRFFSMSDWSVDFLGQCATAPASASKASKAPAATEVAINKMLYIRHEK